MSIDLTVVIESPLHLRHVMPRIAAALADMLGVARPPTLTLDELNHGVRSPATTDELRDRSSPFFLLSIQGEPEPWAPRSL